MAQKKRKRRSRKRTSGGDLGRVARVITVPGKGVRCQDERGKFTSCLAGDLGEYGAIGSVARVITIPGRGVRCQDERGKFTACLAGDLGEYGDLGRIRGRARRTARRTARRVTKRKLGEYISGRGYRCRTAQGQFTKCR